LEVLEFLGFSKVSLTVLVLVSVYVVSRLAKAKLSLGFSCTALSCLEGAYRDEAAALDEW
jgi:hypothetical protein